MRCPELLVSMHEYFREKYEILVPYMHYPKVWLKPLTFYIKTVQKLVSDYLS